MLTIKIIIICLIIFELWFFQILYKNKYNNEVDANMEYMDRVSKWSDEVLSDQEESIEKYKKLLAKKQNIERELLSRDKKYNELLIKYNDLKKNRIAKVISEEKIERVEGTK